jgi:drug/metabolite transporter (DMT)-like permease
MDSTAHPLRGVLFALAGTFLFACMDTTIKFLSSHYPVPLVVAVRYVVHCALMVLVLAPSQGRSLLQAKRTGLVLFRASCLAGASLLFALALKRIPVAEGTAMLFVAPLLVVLVAGPLLKERVGAFEWGAAITGFCGILLIARPGGGLDPLAVALALSAACLTTTYQLLSRLLASTERTLTLLFYTALVGAVVFGSIAPFFWGGERPTPLYLALFLLVGTLGGVGHYLFTAAHRHAAASALAPVTYAQLVWAGLLGWTVTGHVPDPLAVLGMAVVAGSGIIVAVRTQLAARALVRAAEN